MVQAVLSGYDVCLATTFYQIQAACFLLPKNFHHFQLSKYYDCLLFRFLWFLLAVYRFNRLLLTSMKSFAKLVLTKIHSYIE